MCKREDCRVEKCCKVNFIVALQGASFSCLYLLKGRSEDTENNERKLFFFFTSLTFVLDPCYYQLYIRDSVKKILILHSVDINDKA